MAEPLNDYFKQQAFDQRWLGTFNRKKRILLFLRSFIGAVQRVKIYENGKKIITGWYDWKKDATYITWMRK